MKWVQTTLAVLGVTLCGLGAAHSSVIYTYEGLNFTSVTGSGPQVTTANRLTGFVEFATAPVPNESGKTDWVAFSLSDGARTLSSANGDRQFFLADFFDFDASLNIIDWMFSMVPDSETDNANQMLTRLDFDQSRLDAGLTQNATVDSSGTWTAVASVPEPGTLFISALGLLFIARGLTRRHSAGDVRSVGVRGRPPKRCNAATPVAVQSGAL